MYRKIIGRAWNCKSKVPGSRSAAQLAAATYGEAGVAIDCFTGQVLDKQIEAVNE
jgi:hypothetical protein